MSVFITKFLASRTTLSLSLAWALVVAAGCGGAKKAAKTELAPAQQVAVPERVAQPEPKEPPPASAPKKAVPLILDNVHFAFDRYELMPVARDILAKHARALKDRREANVLVEGHCDERGTIEYNLALGERRAKAVVDYLVSLGVERSRLAKISYGKERPLDPGRNETAWAKNRRAQFVVTIQQSLAGN